MNIFALLKELSGQRNTLTIPKLYVRLCDGDHVAALILNQLIYWTLRTKDSTGWIAKTHDDFYEEIMVTPYQLKRAIKGDKRSQTGAILEALGVETKRARSKFYTGRTVMHYRINARLLEARVSAFLDATNMNNVQIENVNNVQVVNHDNVHIHNTKTTAKTTTKIKDSEPTGSQTSPAKSKSTSSKQKPDRVLAELMTPMKDKLAALFNWHWKAGDGHKAMTDAEKGMVQKTAKELCTAGYTPDDAERIYDYCASSGFEKFTPVALTKHASAAMSATPATTDGDINPAWYVPIELSAEHAPADAPGDNVVDVQGDIARLLKTKLASNIEAQMKANGGKDK